MPFTKDQFIKVRPYLFHLTHRDNISQIHRTKILHSAASLMQQAGNLTLLRQKRADYLAIQIGSTTVKIRDQQPLYEGNISLESDWLFEDVIQSLNERVFFWPGREAGPISYGERHVQRYVNEKPVILRVTTADLLSVNPDIHPLFCRFNSGSPRCSNGVGSPRGPNTFVRCGQADFTPSKVVEVTLTEKANLPSTIEAADSITGPWKDLRT